jgi:hypothetical protein
MILKDKKDEEEMNTFFKCRSQSCSLVSFHPLHPKYPPNLGSDKRLNSSKIATKVS